MEPFQEKISTIRQVATNTGRIAAGNPESPLPVDGLEQRQNNKPRATTTAALWMAVGPRRMGICHDKPATSPEAILQLVQCGYSKERCPTNRCQCRKAGLNCTDFATAPTMLRPVIMIFRRKMYSTQIKRTVQIVKCIYMTEPHEQSLTVLITDNHAKIFWGEVNVDFDMLLKLL